MERVARKRDVGPGGQYFASPKSDVEFISSGCKVLDLALGGGWARRRIANIVGDKSTGKTLLCIEASANFAMSVPKGIIRYRESEAAFDEDYARALGLPVDRVDFGDPIDTVEDLFEDLEDCAKKARQPELYIVDSLDALSSRAELKRKIDEPTYGGEKAKMMSQLFRRLVRAIGGKDLTIIIVSQVRSKIGIVFGKKETRTGGRALDFYASQALWLKQIGTLTKTVDKTKRATGITIKGKVEKNKIGLPFRTAEFDVLFGYGIDDLGAGLDYLDKAGRLNTFLSRYFSDHKESVFLRYMREEASTQDYRKHMGNLHAAIEKHWWEVERSFLPERPKYR